LSADDFEDGRDIWRREQPAGSWAAAGVRIGWLGPGAPDCLLVYSRGLVTCEWQGDEMLYRYVPGKVKRSSTATATCWRRSPCNNPIVPTPKSANYAHCTRHK